MGDGIKPKCKLIGEDGNIFFILGRVGRVLKEAGKADQAKECSDRVMNSGSYDEALRIIMEYVEVEQELDMPVIIDIPIKNTVFYLKYDLLFIHFRVIYVHNEETH